MSIEFAAPRGRNAGAAQPAASNGWLSRAAAWYRRHQAANAALVAAGLCTMCGEQPAMADRPLCTSCDGNERAAP
jgi:hypothetical protein